MLVDGLSDPIAILSHFMTCKKSINVAEIYGIKENAFKQFTNALGFL